MKNRGALPEVQSIVLMASDPCATVRHWKILSGRKVVGCPCFFPVPEILHAVGMLPIFPKPGNEFYTLSLLMDEWVQLPEPFPKGLEETLDWVESVAGWAEAASGEACTDGALKRSIRFYRERDILTERLEASSAKRESDSAFLNVGVVVDDFLDPVMLRLALDSGRFLPVETHTMLLTGILGPGPKGMPPTDADPATDPDDDPLLFLARRAQAGQKTEIMRREIL